MAPAALPFLNFLFFCSPLEADGVLLRSPLLSSLIVSFPLLSIHLLSYPLLSSPLLSSPPFTSPFLSSSPLSSLILSFPLLSVPRPPTPYHLVNLTSRPFLDPVLSSADPQCSHHLCTHALTFTLPVFFPLRGRLFSRPLKGDLLYDSIVIELGHMWLADSHLRCFYPLKKNPIKGWMLFAEEAG